jgi:putative transposase
MKISRFNDAQIMGILAQAENGVFVTEFCREQGMSPSRHIACWAANASFYKWRAKYWKNRLSIYLRMLFQKNCALQI